MTGTSYTAIRQLNDIPLPVGFKDTLNRRGIQIEISKSERALLNYILTILQNVDPDILVGHNFLGFGLDVLLHRMKHHKIELNWSKLGRLRRKKWPKLQSGAGGMSESSWEEKQICSGRVVCDTYLTARDLIRSKNYSLQELASSQLGIQREELDSNNIPSMFWNAEDLCRLLLHTQKDAYYSMLLMLKLQVLPLTKQLTNLAGNLWNRTMCGARAERNEYLLLHEFHSGKYIVPDKSFGKQAPVNKDKDGDDDPNQDGNLMFLLILDDARRPGTTGRKKPAYSGGLVLEPKKGYYDKYVLLLDFNSLYPSIIQEYNICFTTVQRDATVWSLSFLTLDF